MPERDDIQLVLDYRAGDQMALELLISRYLNQVYNFVYYLGGRREETADITQEVFIKVWKNIDSFNVGQKFKTWLLTIARNTTIDWLRKKKAIPFSTMEGDAEESYYADTIADETPLPDELFSRGELSATLQTYLGQLPLADQTIILLHHFEELTFEEVAKVVGRPMNTVKSRYRRALATLREALAAAPNKQS